MKTELIRIWGSPLPTPEIEVYTEQTSDEITSYLSQEFELWRNLFHAQTDSCQEFLEAEGYRLAEALVHNESLAHFSLPEKITIPISTSSNETSQTFLVPPSLINQKVGGLIMRLTRKKLNVTLNRKLEELESHLTPSVAAGAGLIRYALVIHLIHHMLPEGNRVVYLTAPGDEIPTIPVTDDVGISPLLPTSNTGIPRANKNYDNRDEVDLQEHYSPAPRCFFLPQWVSFDSQDRLLVNSFHEAEIALNSMQRFMRILQVAISLAPYIIADPEYQEKRYGMLGQLVNQGRAMARYETKEIIQVIQQQVKSNRLNRGLSLKITYFDDQRLERLSRRLEVIPSGRIVFHPAFVVLAMRKERAKVAQDFRLNYSTRRHLQAELTEIERAFDTSKSQ